MLNHASNVDVSTWEHQPCTPNRQSGGKTRLLKKQSLIGRSHTGGQVPTEETHGSDDETNRTTQGTATRETYRPEADKLNSHRNPAHRRQTQTTQDANADSPENR